jgi:hypothetical protein
MKLSYKLSMSWLLIILLIFLSLYVSDTNIIISKVLFGIAVGFGAYILIFRILPFSWALIGSLLMVIGLFAFENYNLIIKVIFLFTMVVYLFIAPKKSKI